MIRQDYVDSEFLYWQSSIGYRCYICSENVVYRGLTQYYANVKKNNWYGGPQQCDPGTLPNSSLLNSYFQYQQDESIPPVEKKYGRFCQPNVCNESTIVQYDHSACVKPTECFNGSYANFATKQCTGYLQDGMIVTNGTAFRNCSSEGLYANVNHSLCVRREKCDKNAYVNDNTHQCIEAPGYN